MPWTWTSTLAALSMTVIAACSSPPAAPGTASSSVLTLEEFFPGRTVAQGSFVNVWTGSKRSFDVTIDGSWDGKTLTLVEDFAFADGERDRKTWKFERQSPGTYVGRREDVVGTARVWTEGKAVRLEYTVEMGGWTVDFSDVLFLQSPDVVTNLATVSKWWIQVGRVELSMRRVSPPS